VQKPKDLAKSLDDYVDVILKTHAEYTFLHLED
jgi:hypothetical protein